MHARALVIQVVVALAVVLAAPSAASARPKPATVSIDAELVTVHATTPPGPNRQGKRAAMPSPQFGRDPALAKPPFAAYTSFQVLRRARAILATGMAWKTTLPNHRDLMIALKAAIVSKKPTEPTRFVVVASIASSGATAFTPVVEATVVAGDTILIPAGRHRRGLVVVAVKLIAP